MKSIDLGVRFCDAYSIAHPIACAGMAFVASLPELAIAVANAGGVPAIGAGIMSADDLKSGIISYRLAANAPLNLSFLTFTFDAEKLALCCALKPEIVSFHWGHPDRAWIDALHACGIRVWEQVGSIDAAQRAFNDDVDLVIIQGSEAGGHNYGELPLGQAIVAARERLGPAPMLLAAGGISDGGDVARIMSLGADGVMLGSRIVASEEANAHHDYKAALVTSTGSDTVRTSIFGREMPFFNPVRVIANDIVHEWHGREPELPLPGEGMAKIGALPTSNGMMPIHHLDSIVPTRGVHGDVSAMMLLAGERIGKIQSIEPVNNIISKIMAEARAATQQRAMEKQ